MPLPDPALAALARLGSRDEFIGDEDYVICNRWGRRLDASALRRRYQRGCEVAGLRRVKLHGLHHAAGSILARVADPVFVRELPGPLEAQHDRPLRLREAPTGGLDRLNRAFAGAPAEMADTPADKVDPAGSAVNE